MRCRIERSLVKWIPGLEEKPRHVQWRQERSYVAGEGSIVVSRWPHGKRAESLD